MEPVSAVSVPSQLVWLVWLKRIGREGRGQAGFSNLTSRWMASFKCTNSWEEESLDRLCVIWHHRLLGLWKDIYRGKGCTNLQYQRVLYETVHAGRFYSWNNITTVQGLSGSLWSLVKAVINRAVASQGLEMHQPALPHSNHTQSGGGSWVSNATRFSLRLLWRTNMRNILWKSMYGIWAYVITAYCSITNSLYEFVYYYCIIQPSPPL